MNDSVMIVDKDDRMYGTMDKMAAHRAGVLHRALSVFIFNSRGELLLQQRALTKYHSGGLWTNTCCSHPRPGETTSAAASRRLKEEMGISCCLEFTFSFYYKATVSLALVEHEIDHVFFGISNEVPCINAAEAAAYKYMGMDELAAALRNNPKNYTAWLAICFDSVMSSYFNLFKK